MLIALFVLFRTYALPTIIVYAKALFDSVGVIVIMLIAIAMMLGLNLRRVSNDAASGIYTVFRDIVRLSYRALRWLAIRLGRLGRRVYTNCRTIFLTNGLNNILSNLFSALITLVVILVIIWTHNQHKKSASFSGGFY